MVKRFMYLICFVAVGSAIMITPVSGKPVEGYNSYIKLLPGGKSKQVSNFELISAAQSEIVENESEKRGRTIRFNRPLEIYELNAKYVMITFDVSYKPEGNSRFSNKPAVFGLLFEGTDPNGLRHYTRYYLKWIGNEDVEEYRASKVFDFCEYYRRIGVEDCIPAGLKIARQKNIKVNKSNENKLVPNTSLVRKKEFNLALKNNEQKMSEVGSEINKQAELIEKQSEMIENQAAMIETLSNRLNAIESLNETPDNEAEDVSGDSAGDIASLNERIKSLEGIINKSKQKEQALESTINTLSRLLTGVSRRNNDLVFEGLNVRIVNGSGQTEGHVNGTGNLIVGYNEKKPGESLREGSHQIIAPNLKPETKEKHPKTSGVEEGEVKTSGICFIESIFEQ